MQMSEGKEGMRLTMKKELIICFTVISIVVIGNILTQNYTKQSAKEMNEKLYELRTELTKEEKNKDKITEKVGQVKEKWEERQELLAYYIEHDELEKVETQIYLLSGEVETELYEDAVPEIEKCIFILQHIEDKTALNVKNIF